MISKHEKIDALMQEARRLLHESERIYEAVARGDSSREDAIKTILGLNERALELINEALGLTGVAGRTASATRKRPASRSKRAN